MDEQEIRRLQPGDLLRIPSELHDFKFFVVVGIRNETIYGHMSVPLSVNSKDIHDLLKRNASVAVWEDDGDAPTFARLKRGDALRFQDYTAYRYLLVDHVEHDLVRGTFAFMHGNDSFTFSHLLSKHPTRAHWELLRRK